MTAAELTRLETAHRRAVSTAETARRRRNAAVVIAVAEGASIREVADLLGVSRQRVDQIVRDDGMGATA